MMLKSTEELLEMLEIENSMDFKNFSGFNFIMWINFY